MERGILAVATPTLAGCDRILFIRLGGGGITLIGIPAVAGHSLPWVPRPLTIALRPLITLRPLRWACCLVRSCALHCLRCNLHTREHYIGFPKARAESPLFVPRLISFASQVVNGGALVEFSKVGISS